MNQELEMSVYTTHGFADRADYLENVAEQYDAPLDQVLILADLLGPEEDFDGLVSMMNDVYN